MIENEVAIRLNNVYKKYESAEQGSESSYVLCQ